MIAESQSPRTPRASRLDRLAISLIRSYQRLAPGSIRSACRFSPTCSDYMALAIRKYGASEGVRLGLQRIRRCRPPNGGVDEP